MTNLVNKDTYRHKDTEVWTKIGAATGDVCSEISSNSFVGSCSDHIWVLP